ncbi:MAG: calcium-translocating P-type ATPase, PMCA-type [Acutalibacteraceae bacterium]|nr:calcium-translocating P-type ATPase, PMCA-type [Acutalibacteraceae bacterium]
MDWHSLTPEQTARELGTNLSQGISEQNAKNLLAKNGKNLLKAEKKDSVLKQFLRQFSDFCVIILFIACIISFMTGIIEGKGDFVEPIVILLIVILNAAMGVYQERRAERALEVLQKMSAPVATVIRSGNQQKIPAQLLVPGDIILLESGDMVPADARLIESNSLTVQESALTGESEPCEKSAGLILPAECAVADRKNMIFSSTTVLSGNCRAIVTETGMLTRVGRIAHLLSSEDAPQTPLQIRLGKIGKALGIGALVICAFVFILGIVRKSGILPSFMLSVSLAVAAIPEGLPAIVTIVLSMGVQRMAKSNAIIRHLPAVETLGATTVICSDKTGTLTQNKMTVTQVRNTDGLLSRDNTEAKKILTFGALCNNARCVKKGKLLNFSGDPTETAILSAAADCGEKIPDLSSAYPRLSETPFSSENKFMATVNTVQDKKLLIVKGAPDVILKSCTKAEYKNSAHTLSSALRNKILRHNEDMASQALRVIAVAYRDCSGARDREISNLTFLGLIGMIDPPRPEAAKAVATCKKAGIIPVMITGDHITTACAVAKNLGILEDGYTAVTGNELDRMDDSKLKEAIKNCRVFARVSPEHKVRIVKAFRASGHIVAMTGDGVNDAPALKAADIGCAMGKGGTDVAKNAADMILTDDNFATIVKAVERGRGIYDNIKKAVHFLLGTNIGEILTVFAASLLGLEAPLIPIQLLWVNLVTDSLPAMALGTEKTEPDIMRRAPVSPEKGFFSDGHWLDISLEGMLVGTITILAFLLGTLSYGTQSSLILGRTMAFCTLSFCEITHAINMRSSQPLYKTGFFSNKTMNMAFILCCAVQAAVVIIPPLARIFGVTALSGMQWMTVTGLSLIPLAAGEAGKILFKNRK